MFARRCLTSGALDLIETLGESENQNEILNDKENNFHSTSRTTISSNVNKNIFTSTSSRQTARHSLKTLGENNVLQLDSSEDVEVDDLHAATKMTPSPMDSSSSFSGIPGGTTRKKTTRRSFSSADAVVSDLSTSGQIRTVPASSPSSFSDELNDVILEEVGGGAVGVDQPPSNSKNFKQINVLARSLSGELVESKKDASLLRTRQAELTRLLVCANRKSEKVQKKYDSLLEKVTEIQSAIESQQEAQLQARETQLALVEATEVCNY